MFKNGEGFESFDSDTKDNKRERRGNSMVRKFSLLTSQTKAATYILILLLILSITFLPFSILLPYDMIYHFKGGEDTALNLEISQVERIFSCLKNLIREENCVQEETIKEDDFYETEKLLDQLSHNEEMLYYEYFTRIIPLFHTLLNPIIYALWYSEFRAYAFGFTGLFIKKKKNVEENVTLSLQYVTIK